MNETIYPISSIVRYIKSTLDQNPYLNGIRIQGEISNLKKHRSGHWYFTLKDEQARLSCVMFATYASRCQAAVRDGMKVIVKGSISMYEQQGSVQCYVTAIREDGIGDLYLRYEQLKKKLFDEGWFDDAHNSRSRPMRAISPSSPQRRGRPYRM
ncbi:MAG: exodeoxyribonuclease VII large subunit [Merdibacter sp.]